MTKTDFSSVKLIASDMDHTLLQEDSTLPDGFAQQLDELNACDVQFVMASGRPLTTLEEMFPAHLNQLGLIGDNGATIKLGGKLLHSQVLPKAAYLDMIRFEQANFDGVIVASGIEMAYAASKDRQYKNYVEEFYRRLTFVDDLAALNADDITKITIYLPHAKPGDAQRLLDSKIAPRYGQKFATTIGGSLWVDIMAKGINKGNGLLTLGDQLNLGADQMMAFGDDMNDKEMLQTVKYSYTVDNANPALKPFASFHTSTN